MDTVTKQDSVTSSAKRRDAISPTPWRLHGQTIRDAEGVVVMSALNPADMTTRRLIVEAVNERDRLRDLVGRLTQRLQMARLMGFGLPERDGLLDEAREALGEGE